MRLKYVKHIFININYTQNPILEKKIAFYNFLGLLSG